MIKKTISLILSIALIFLLCVPAYAAADAPDISAEGSVVMDLTTGKVLFEKNPDEKLYPASLTKMLTAILVIENLSLGKTLKADDEVTSVGGSRLNMKTGEQIGAKDALYVMMIGSCNDLAVLLAKAVSGSVEEFAKLMNQKAAELGCTGSNFVNPSGLHDDDHYTTAHDMALIAKYCMDNVIFRDIVRNATFEYTRGSGAENPGSVDTIKTTNWMLNDTTHTMYVGNVKRTPMYEGCIGIKTGTTSQARGCLAAAAVRGSTTMLTVVMHSDGDSKGSYERFVDTIKLMDWALGNYRTSSIMRMSTELGTIKVKKGAVNKVTAVLASDIYITLSSDQSDSSITTEVELDSTLRAPVSQGMVCGKVSVYQDGTLIGQYDAVTASKVDEGGVLSNFGIEDAVAKKIFGAVIAVIVIVIVAFAGYIVYLKIKSERIKKRKAARARARREAEERERENGPL